jgi:aminoglycoside phosphotransferase (APT) family kinase protein
MLSWPVFVSEADYVAHRGDVGFWRPYLVEILGRHGLVDARHEPEAGIGPTYPTFLYGHVAVKLFGYRRWWREGQAAEQAAHAVLATDPAILAPRLLASGQLFENGRESWPYLISERVPGLAWHKAGLTAGQRQVVAAELGDQIRRVQALHPAGVTRRVAWPELDVTAAARRSSLPPQLVAQVDGYLARLGPFDPVFVNGDMMYRHIFVEDGRLSAIIDWGDAIITDRHYELAKLHLDTFDGDKGLLRAFLAASDWPVAGDFAQKGLAHALYRQAFGLVQHHSMDVFYKLPDQLSLQEIETLEQLAEILFAI